MTDGIYQRGGVWWSSYSHRGKEIRESVKKVTGKNTEAAAKQLRKERVRTAGTPGFVDPTRARRLTFDDLASMYLCPLVVHPQRAAHRALRCGLDRRHRGRRPPRPALSRSAPLRRPQLPPRRRH